MAVAYSKTNQSITVTVGFVPKTIPSTHVNYEEIVKLARDPKTTEAQIAPLLDVAKTIETVTGGNVVVKNGQLFYKGYEVKGSLSTAIVTLIRSGQGEAAEPLKLFLDKAFANPDPRAATDLFDWVVHSKLPITPTGDILAWKAVRDDYLSIHQARRGDRVFDHHVGNIVEEDRSYCDANPDRTCSRGLHFASAAYMKHYAGGGNRIVALKISPTDVVAFPRDYGWEKGRAAKYQVVGEVPEDQVAEFYPQGKRVYDWSKRTPTAPSAAGQVWLRRDGKEVTIAAVSNGTSTYPVRDTLNNSYLANGRYVGEREDHSFDLVRFIR